MDAGLLLARMVFGLVMAAHGTQKLFGWFGGYGLAGTGGFFESLGFRPGRFFAAAAGGTGDRRPGCCVALGLLGPLGPAMIVSVMIVAMATVHWPNGLFAQNNGIEVPLLYSAAAAAIALVGNGAYSLDAAARPVLAGRGGLDRARPRGPGRIRESRDPEDRTARGARLNYGQDTKVTTKDTKVRPKCFVFFVLFVVAL